MVDHYRDVIQLIAKFTVESLQVRQNLPHFKRILAVVSRYGNFKKFTDVAVRSKFGSLSAFTMATYGGLCSLRKR